MLAAPASPAIQAAAHCKLGRLAELPIVMEGLKPTISAKINDRDAQFILDSGAWFSMISSATAAQFNLELTPAPFGLKVAGVGGSTDTAVATVKVFTLVDIPLHHVKFLVGGSEVGGGAVGLLGQDFLQGWDVEYDLARGVVRLFKAEDCGHTNLAYWVSAGQAMSMVDIEYTSPQRPHATAAVYLNGTKITAMFDSGASTSMLSLKAAARAGLKPDTPGLVDAGYGAGIGRSLVKNYIAPVDSFKIGDNEEIHNTRLRIADIDLDAGDMLLGADFFLSHHILISNSQHRVYFTYNGGPVFNLSQPAAAAGAAANAADAAGNRAPDDEPADAAGYARRGNAYAGRRDFARALADLQRACELNPNEPEYLYQRGTIHRENQQISLAMADFDRALEIKPGYPAALIARAWLRLYAKNISAAVADMDSVDRLVPQQADVRFNLGDLYEAADLLQPSLAQFDLWIANHPDDSKMARALNSRCWLRALKGEDLAKALGDCNAALRRAPKSSPAAAAILDSRGLVRLRLGDYDKAIEDYGDSLKFAPRGAWSLYGRGVARIRKHQAAQGEADIAQATSLWPEVADEFTKRGIVP